MIEKKMLLRLMLVGLLFFGTGCAGEEPAEPDAPAALPGPAEEAPGRAEEAPAAQTPAERPRTGEAGGGAADGSEWTAGIVDEPADIAGTAVLQEVRAARHEGYDRVVFEFAGGALPGYHLEYIDEPVRQCGSGEVVPLPGDGWLQVRFVPAQAHTEAGEATVENREIRPMLPVLKELELTCDFEADVTWVLGVSAPNRYRVQELQNPARLAVDIRH